MRKQKTPGAGGARHGPARWFRRRDRDRAASANEQPESRIDLKQFLRQPRIDDARDTATVTEVSAMLVDKMILRAPDGMVPHRASCLG